MIFVVWTAMSIPKSICTFDPSTLDNPWSHCLSPHPHSPLPPKRASTIHLSTTQSATISSAISHTPLISTHKPPYSSSFPTPTIPINSVSNTNTLFAGIGPIARLPYAMSAGTVNLRFSPTHMSLRPSSQPLITRPAPSWNSRGFWRE